MIQQQKRFYSQFKDQQLQSVHVLIRLDSKVSKDLANLLRLEKNHKDALVHIIYWVSNASISMWFSQDQESKLRAYFDRAKLMGPTFDDVYDYCKAERGKKEFYVIQKDVDSWV